MTLEINPSEWLKFGQIIGQIDEECTVLIPLHSPPAGSNRKDESFLRFSLPRIQLQLALIFVVTRFLHYWLKRLYMPRSLSELLAGFVLGKTLIGKLFPQFKETLYPKDDPFLEILSKLGFIFYLFLVGVKMDITAVSKAGVKGFVMGISVTIFPVVFSALLYSYLIDVEFPLYKSISLSAVVGVQLIIPYPVVSCLLIDMKIMNSELGRMASAAALISSLLSATYTTMLSLLRLKIADGRPIVAYKASSLIICSVLVILLVMHKASTWIIQRTPEGKPVNSAFIMVIAMAVPLVAILGDNMGLHYHVLPFVLGVVVPDGLPLGSTLVERLETLVSGLFAPLMMTICALEVDLWVLYDIRFVASIWKVILSLCGLKFVSVLGAAICCKVSFRDAAALSTILNAQGIVELALYHVFHENQTIDDDVFGTVVLSVFLIQCTTTIFLKYVYNYSPAFTYRGYNKRSILHASSNAELRVLVCTHRQEDISAEVKLLEISSPTKESPIAAYALNLVELVGRATPLFINHGLGQMGTSFGIRSQQLVEAFLHLKKSYPGISHVQVFTSVSLPKFMHEDICSLAFDKLCSLIVLPFHKKWNHQGQVVFNSNIIRAINRKVLDMAPCSVGIHVDRHKIRQEAAPIACKLVEYVGIVFIGGFDDREALAYGKRLVKLSRVHLTVVRLVAAVAVQENQWDMVLDTEALKEIKLQGTVDQNIVYREEVVKDGPETALIIATMEEAFDMILAGRRHKVDSPLLAGITECQEFPEFGVVGDILASSQVQRPVSVLILQQQILRNN